MLQTDRLSQPSTLETRPNAAGRGPGLKIAQVTATFPPYQAGTGNVCFYNARELARRGHQVEVFTAALAAAPATEELEGFKVHRLKPLLRVGNAPLLPQLLTELRGFDLIHLHYPFISGSEVTALAALLHCIPLVVTYHNDLIYSGTLRDGFFRLENWLGRHSVLYRAKRLLFVSQGHARTSNQSQVYFKRQSECRILPNGVDTRQFSPMAGRAEWREKLGLPLEGQVICFVGGLDPAHHYKGLSVLLAALGREELQTAFLVVVGDGSLKEQYRQEARRLGLAERVRFCGKVANQDLAPYYGLSDVTAMPSLVAESFGLVAVESLACGIPVVASDGPGVRSILEAGRDLLLVEPGKPVELAKALATLLNDKPLRQALARQGRQKVQDYYDWGTIGGQLEQIYFEALGVSV